MDLFNLVAKITLDSNEYEQGLKNAESKASNIGGKIGGAFKTAGTIAAAGVGVASAAVVALTKSAVDSYANYEQLVGGVETLFGAGGMSLEQYAKSVGKSVNDAKKDYNTLLKSQNTVLKNADKAYKTAGLSANAYMEQATSTAAALIGSLGGDTEKAAEMADMAIVDMSDNVNKMGSSVESVQNAYNGFAKGNFTMLDNLKLGYGGTKEEMQRLLDKAGEISGFKYDISSYSDIVEAIHVVQTEMGITGTTQKEASTTISGSLSMVKASWENLVTAFGRGGDETKTAVEDLVDSVKTFIGNLVPAVVQILGNIGSAVVDAIPQLADEIPPLITAFLPKLLDAVGNLITSLWNALPAMFESIKAVLATLITIISDYLNEHFPTIGAAFDKLVEIGGNAFRGIQEVWNTVLKPALGELWTFVTDTIVPKFQEAWPKIQWAAEQVFLKLKDLWDNTLKPAFEAIWVFIAETLVPKFQEYWPKVQWAVEQVFIKIKDIWSNTLKPALDEIWKFVRDTVFPKFQEYWPKIQWAVEQVFIKIKDVWDSILKPAFTALYNFVVDTLYPKFQEYWPIIQGFVTDVFDAIKKAWGNKDSGLYGVFYKISEVIKKLKNTFDTVWKREGGIGQIINDAWNTIKHKWEQSFGPVWDAISEVVSNLKETFSKVWDAIETTLTNTWNTLTELYDSTIGPVFNGIADAINAAYDAASKVFGTGEGSIYATVSNGIGWIKGLLNFDWSLPAPHLPSFHWDWTDYGWISIPHFWLEWNRKAYNNPFMFTKPTIMGNYGFGDGNGGEIVYGHDSLMSDIRSAMSEAGGNRGSFNVQINVTQLPDEDTEQFATRVSEIIAQQYDREEAVFA